LVYRIALMAITGQAKAGFRSAVVGMTGMRKS